MHTESVLIRLEVGNTKKKKKKETRKEKKGKKKKSEQMNTTYLPQIVIIHIKHI